MRPRDKIKTIQDYDKFLRSRGFSKRETKILCRAWKDLEPDKTCGTLTIGELIKKQAGIKTANQKQVVNL